MAPKKRSGKVVKTVVKKVVEETVKVVVTRPPGEDNGTAELISTSTTENQNVEVFTSPPEKVKTISVEEKTPQDDDETQPLEEPEVTPTPPQKEAPPPKQAETPEKKVEEKRKVKEKTEKSGVEPKRRRKRRGGGEGGEGGAGYKTYVYKVMKQVHPDMGISSKAMTIINNLMADMFERLAAEAALLVKYTGRSTMSSREVQGAVKLVLPGELGKHAVAEGTKAVTNYVSYAQKKT
ncbi:hypothetical protein BUALT_Bualt02G0035500 [Buddleja alternifolia]|uniref:Core Histone H2A/H2B/H3 domain-containing protein n=1 Tax=Buddleja alternifolia TaxID=168488 RepID=A0AAV6Y4A0_9LAMI|nr:hypothetical protein BUALT_Bualt02G0035500 [Buddleja alternifolia]